MIRVDRYGPVAQLIEMLRADHDGLVLQDLPGEHVMDPPRQRIARIVAPVASRGGEPSCQTVDCGRPGFIDRALERRADLRHPRRMPVREELRDRLDERLPAARERAVSRCRTAVIVCHQPSANRS